MPTTQKPKSFRLLDLPAELQLRVIEFAVTKDAPVCINIGAFAHVTAESPNHDNVKQKWDAAKDEGQNLPRAICQANRTIRADALKMYYRRNDFIVAYCIGESEDELEIMEAWLQALDRSRRQQIGKVLMVDAWSTYARESPSSEPFCWRDGGGLDFVAGLGADVEDGEGACVFHVSFPATEANSSMS